MIKQVLILMVSLAIGNSLLSQTILGTDVSALQGSITWNSVASTSNGSFTFIKATKGNCYTDGQFYTNIANAHSAGIKAGCYHFALPEDSRNTPTTEAAYFLSTAQSYIGTGYLPPVLDLEDPAGTCITNSASLTSSFTSVDLTAWVVAWCSYVQQHTGVAPIIYTNRSIAAYLGSGVTAYGLWIADPDGSTTVQPSTGVWSTWLFKQYSWTGSVSGITGSVDLDVFNGNAAALNALAGSSCTAVTVSGQPQSTTVSSGSTASFTVSVNGTGPFSYFWYNATTNTFLISTTNTSATSNTLTTSALTSGNSGTCYYCLITNCNSGNQVQSNNACVTVTNPCATPTPPTSVSTSPQTYCAGSGTVTLQLTGSLASGSTWVWYAGSCGGTQVGTGANVFGLTPSQTTTYYARAESSCGSGNSACLSTTITVVPVPSAPHPTASPNPVCQGQTFTLNANVTGSPYEWTYNGSFISGTQNPIQTASNVGTGSYCLTYQSNGCQSAQGCVSVTVSSPPTISFSQGGQLSVCSSGANSTLQLQALGANTYTWSPPTGLSATNVSNPTVSNLGNTTLYTVTGTDANGCTASNSVNVNVSTTPTVSVTPASSSICAGGQQTLSATQGAGSYAWSSGQQSATINVNPTNTTTYTVTAANGNCSATATATVTVNSVPSVAILPANPVIGCGQNSVTLSLSTTGQNYSWSNSGTGSTNVVSAAGTYTVTVTNPGGCTGSATASVTVNQTSGLLVSAGSNQTVAPGAQVTLGGSPTASGGSGNYTYNWSASPAGNVSNVANPVVSPTITTTYSLTVNDGTGCTGTSSVTVNVNNSSCDTAIHVTITNNNCELVVPQYTGAAYQWQLNGSNIAMATSRFYAVTASGIYTAQVTIQSCSYTKDVSVDLSAGTCDVHGVGIDQIELADNLVISPNPSNGSFTISLNTTRAGEIQFKMYDLTGRLLQAETPVKVTGAYTRQMDLGHMAKGVYVLQIQTDNGVVNKKIEVN